MTDLRTAPYAAFVLRVILGVLFLAHAALKIFVYTPGGTVHFFSQAGVPGELAYPVMLAEILGGSALVLGVWSRLVALALTPILLGAILTVHGANGWLFTNTGGGWEFPAFWIVGLVVLAGIGDGAWALRPTPELRPAALRQHRAA